MHRSEFIKELKETFPEITERVNAHAGLLHLEISEFRHFTQQHIRNGDEGATRKCFALAERAFLQGNTKLRNAVDVSFVEELEFTVNTKRYTWAWECLPETLKGLFIAFHKRPGV
jgi:hypothetical protein